MEGNNILSGNFSDSEAEKRLRALKGETFSFNESEYRDSLISQGKGEVEINALVTAEREKIRKANERAKSLAMEEEQEKSVELLEREMNRHLKGDESQAA
jgi:hypothetical protein